MHFCAGLPIILVGCKKDLRREPRVIEELRKTAQRPVTPEEVRLHLYRYLFPSLYTFRYLSDLSPLRSRGCAHLNFTGHGCCAEDRCQALPRVLCKVRRRCRGGFPICHPCSARITAKNVQQARLRRHLSASGSVFFFHPRPLCSLPQECYHPTLSLYSRPYTFGLSPGYSPVPSLDPVILRALDMVLVTRSSLPSMSCNFVYLHRQMCTLCVMCGRGVYRTRAPEGDGAMTSSGYTAKEAELRATRGRGLASLGEIERTEEGARGGCG